MVYKTAQKRFENKADRVKLLGAFYRNLAIIAGESSKGNVEIDQNTAEVAASYLLFVEGLTTGFREEYNIDVESALRRISSGHREHTQGGLYPTERSLLKAAITARFVSVTAGTNGDIVRFDDRADWALGLDGLGIARAAAYALLGEKPRV